MTTPPPGTPPTSVYPAAPGGAGGVADVTVPIQQLTGAIRQPNQGIIIPGLEGYSSVELIAHGSSAVVYRAVQDRLKRQVAIKLLLIDDMMTTLENVEFELDTLVRLSQQPHIVSIIDTGFTEAGQPFIVMEYCEGGSYAQILKERGPLPVDEVLDVGIKIGEALHAAHEVGIVHRDVKPPNILRSRFGPALTDFGIAYAEELSTTTTFMKLTPHHASPEALLQQHQSGKSDLYSLASTMWNLLAGAPPFDSPGQNPEEFRRRVLTQPVPRIPRNDIPEWLQAELARGMAKRPAHRHLSALEFSETLRLRRAQPAGGSWAAPAEDSGVYRPGSAPPHAGEVQSVAPVSSQPRSTPPASSPPIAPDASPTIVTPYRPASPAAPFIPANNQPPANIAGTPFAGPSHVGHGALIPSSPGPPPMPPASSPPQWPGRPVNSAPVSTPAPPPFIRPAPIEDEDEEETSWKRPLLTAVILGVILGLIVTIGILLVRKSDEGGGNKGPTKTPQATQEAKPIDTYKPKNVQLEDNGSNITIKWQDTSDGEVSFVIFGAADGEAIEVVDSASAGELSKTISDLRADVNYCFKVAALVPDKNGTTNYASSETKCTNR